MAECCNVSRGIVESPAQLGVRALEALLGYSGGGGGSMEAALTRLTLHLADTVRCLEAELAATKAENAELCAHVQALARDVNAKEASCVARVADVNRVLDELHGVYAELKVVQQRADTLAAENTRLWDDVCAVYAARTPRAACPGSGCSIKEVGAELAARPAFDGPGCSIQEAG